MSLHENPTPKKQPRTVIHRSRRNPKLHYEIDFLRNVEIGLTNPGHTVKLTLTPELAQFLVEVERNPANRVISLDTVNKYSRDIKNGDWKFNGETIVVSREGLLNTGQHRCLAVIDADASMETLIVFGIERDTRSSTDQGRGKRPADRFAMEGILHSRIASAVAKFAWQILHLGTLSGQTYHSPTNAQAMAVYRQHPEAIQRSIAAIPRAGAIVGGRELLAFCHFAFTLRCDDVRVADEFTEKLINGHDLAPKHPILNARNRLWFGKRLQVAARAELLFKSWNYWRRSETPRALNILGGKLPNLER